MILNILKITVDLKQYQADYDANEKNLKNGKSLIWSMKYIVIHINDSDAIKRNFGKNNLIS